MTREPILIALYKKRKSSLYKKPIYINTKNQNCPNTIQIITEMMTICGLCLETDPCRTKCLQQAICIAGYSAEWVPKYNFWCKNSSRYITPGQLWIDGPHHFQLLSKLFYLKVLVIIKERLCEKDSNWDKSYICPLGSRLLWSILQKHLKCDSFL